MPRLSPIIFLWLAAGLSASPDFVLAARQSDWWFVNGITFVPAIAAYKFIKGFTEGTKPIVDIFEWGGCSKYSLITNYFSDLSARQLRVSLQLFVNGVALGYHVPVRAHTVRDGYLFFKSLTLFPHCQPQKAFSAKIDDVSRNFNGFSVEVSVSCTAPTAQAPPPIKGPWADGQTPQHLLFLGEMVPHHSNSILL